MTKLKGIYTIRDTAHEFYWDIVFEWEDELSKALNLPLIPIGSLYDSIYKPSLVRKFLNRLNYYQTKDKFLFTPTEFYIAFHIGPPGVYSFHSRKDVIPIIIDFWKSENLKKFESIFSLSKIVFVTSKQVYNYLRKEQVNINIGHLALSLPDKHFFDNNFEKKEFDLIQVGRQNDTLTHYVKLLLSEFPQINYLYGEKIDGRMQMFSTTKGKLGEFASRESFIGLLRKTKISILSGPGLDEDDAKRTGGFSPVTPRFLESAACGCHLIGLYASNEDFDYYGIKEVCVNVKDYKDFRMHVLKKLAEPLIPDYQFFLRRHLTSKRALELKEYIPS